MLPIRSINFIFRGKRYDFEARATFETKPHVAEPSLHSEAIEEIDRALRVLFLCSEFPDLCYVLFRKFVAGSLSVEEQELLKKLGAKL